ncbi:MAG: AAA family ATPase [Streptosporangiaceae bacterium]
MDGAELSARPAHVFVGRVPELAALSAALAAASAGEPKVVLLQGEAGFGKSSLVSEFLGSRPGVPVVTVSGEESEAFLPYGLVRQLAAGAAAVCSHALAGVELLADGPREDADPLAVGVELLAVISCLQAGGAVVVLIEDLQWADLASARALLFACRRLYADRVLVILTGRPGGTSLLGEGWERFVSSDRRAARLTLSGLSISELGALCGMLGRAGLPQRVLRRVREQTGGSPLLARALLAELTDESLTAAGGALRAPRSLAELIQPQLAALPAAARDLVAAASVLGDHCTLADAAELAGTTAPAAVLGDAERAGFLLEQETPAGWRISFAHPLVRRAVYGGLGAQRRRDLHLRAAAIAGGEEALAHRAAAAAGPDPDLAADLDQAAGEAAGAGRPRLAARYLSQAAAVTARGPERDERLLSAFELLLRAADVAQAEAVRPEVEMLAASARRDAALGQLAVLAARPLDAQDLLTAAWDAHDPVTEAAAGAEAALGLGMLLGISGRLTESTRWLDRALSKAGGTEPWYDAARGMRAIPFTLNGEADKALSLFRDLPERAAMAPMPRTDAITFRGLARLWTGDLQGAAEDLSLAARRIRAGLQVRFPGQPLAYLAEAEFRRGNWDECQGHAELAVSLARDADRYYDLPLVHSAAARVPACRGDWAAADSHVRAAEDAARAFGGIAAIFAASARSILGFARNDPAEALRGAAMALAVPEIDCYDDPAAFWWRPLQIWAMVCSGQLDDAEAALAAFTTRAAERRETLALLNAAWTGGLLKIAQGQLEQAEQTLRDGCRTAACEPFPFHRAVLDLQYGRCLSRRQHRKAAIAAIRAADDVFTALAARPFMQAARAELAALGVRRKAGGDPDLPGLTPRELRVARLVASGLSNREAAAQLYLSPKTVEYHLASVFTKLGVSSRHQLAARIGGREPPWAAAWGENQGNPGSPAGA